MSYRRRLSAKTDNRPIVMADIVPIMGTADNRQNIGIVTTDTFIGRPLTGPFPWKKPFHAEFKNQGYWITRGEILSVACGISVLMAHC